MDIVQDAMLKLVQKYSHRPPEEWGALFHTILHSRINDWHRRRAVRSRWHVMWEWGADEENEEGREAHDRVAQTQFAEPEPFLMQQEWGKLMQGAIAALPLRQQQALLLRAWEGFDIAETAKIMQCSPGSVKTHYARAIHSLREKLGDSFYEQ